MKTSNLRVMTFNIRYGRAPDGKHAWLFRRELVVERIRAFSPDLLGLQECRDDEQADFVRSHLPDYHFIGFHRGGEGEPASEMAPLLFRRAVFELRDYGCFWLSESPQIPGSSDWGTALPRPVTWARLLHNGLPLLFMNAHYDHASTKSRTQSSSVLLREASRIAPEEPLVVCGDFNARKTSLAYRRLTGQGGLIDVYRALHPTGSPQGTFHDFGRVRPEPIDWILASPHFAPREAAIDRTISQDGVYPSDHYPLTAVLDR